jgi:hypothetical protein
MINGEVASKRDKVVLEQRNKSSSNSSIAATQNSRSLSGLAGNTVRPPNQHQPGCSQGNIRSSRTVPVNAQ